MIRINLLPYRVARRQQQIMHHVSIFFGVVIIAALLALSAHTASSLQLADLKEETLLLQKQNAELKHKIGKIHNLDALRTDVERKLKTVDRLQEGRFHSLKTLHEVAQVIPENVWVKTLKHSGTDITLSGLGESNKAVANFMRKLDRSPLFDNVQLTVISRVMVNGLPVRSFNLKIRRVEESAKAKTADAKKGAS
ncbi:type IV pilus assembly protein PilN [Mariprofundus micogutta]|uniref:Type IV pilus assembly protein PilN n=1 Tax=Mariprofundus micogutta TaxID=1921010 RepID=A0A1L8CR08_9PROT|nr:PilN domain-containing protein [Mariprofundus micogutta]GAV21259.1 type IV pilus assembly protein PilN [Mariprofundus micogutta]